MSAQPNNLLLIDDTPYETQLPSKFENRKPYSPHNPKTVIGHIPGVIVKINIRHGQNVKQGESLLILEAMKMQNDIIAPVDGTIKVILVSEGQKTRKDQVLVEFD